MDKTIDEIYKPKNGGVDSWKGGLKIDGDRLERFLGDESPVFSMIQTAGEHLLHARQILREHRDENSSAGGAMSDTSADEMLEALSCCARLPSMRFFNIMLAMDQHVEEALERRCPKKFSDLPWTDAQYHATVVYFMQLQITYQMNQESRLHDEETIIGGIIRAGEALIKARPNDASIYVTFGNWLAIHGFQQDAQGYLRKAVELDEDACFGSYYTRANMYYNGIIDLQGNTGAFDQLRVGFFVMSFIDDLRRYLELAPAGHWHTHRACMSLILVNAKSKVHGATESVTSIAERHPEFCTESYSLFQRGLGALQLYENCYGEEADDFHEIYRQVAGLIAKMKEEDLLDETCKIPSNADYICAYPPCTNSKWMDGGDDQERSTKLCVRCESVSYCSKQCQTRHWKSSHKKECKKLAAALQGRRAANEKTSRPTAWSPDS